MCYRPLSIRIKPRNFNPNGGQLFSTHVSCCSCPACQLSKKDEWSFRIFYEIDDTLSKGGFVLSQALTYSDDCVPWLSQFVSSVSPKDDIMCFNRKHITNFMKLLRIRLERAGYNVVGSLRYFISSEYGSDPSKTRRPHYHGTWYSTVRHSDGHLLDWQTLSSFIEDCWPFGRSDGFLTISKEMYNPLNYFFDPFKPHVLLPEDSLNFLKFNKIANYVSKYVVKDISYSNTIRQRCGDHLDKLWVKDRFSYNSELRRLKSLVKEFHLQSLGFGANLLKYNNFDDIMKSGCIKKPSADPNKGLFDYIPIPLYFARKLFMTLRKRHDKSLYWCYTIKGKEFFKLRYFSKIKNLYNKYLSIYDSDDVLRKQVDDLLSGRSLLDFVEYVCVYKGRSKPLFPSDFTIPSINEMFNSMCSVYDDLSQTYNIKFDEGKFFVSDDVPFYLNLYQKLNSYDSCFSQLDSPFHDFDDLFALFAQKIAIINQAKEVDAIFKLEFPNHFKNNYK